MGSGHPLGFVKASRVGGYTSRLLLRFAALSLISFGTLVGTAQAALSMLAYLQCDLFFFASQRSVLVMLLYQCS